MIRAVNQLWNKIGNKGFWGGIFDSRFYVANLIHKEKFDTLLDLGSGSGIILHLVNAKLKVGIDFNFEPIRDAKKLDPSLEIICADIRNLPLRDNYFNTILSLYSISGFPTVNERRQVFEEMNRVSSNNKSSIIITANNILSKYLKKVPSHKREAHVRINELIEYFDNEYETKLEGYNAFPKWELYILKIILLRSPNWFLDIFNLEERIINLLKSEKVISNSRSFILTCTKN